MYHIDFDEFQRQLAKVSLDLPVAPKRRHVQLTATPAAQSSNHFIVRRGIEVVATVTNQRGNVAPCFTAHNDRFSDAVEVSVQRSTRRGVW